MGKVYEHITPELSAWVAQQKMFFVATAPLSGAGLVNCSPKGGDSFRILNEHQVAYQDLTGSGIETIAHLRENSRIVVMFCAFEGAPKIVRFHGAGEVVGREHPEFAELVPLYEFREPRLVLDKWAESQGDDGLRTYRQSKNTQSLDGLPGLAEES
ncbi:pyridoxamine 5'-phosphate oxidase family protein [Armatimonas sp.]|uniref:pyridoxamine 5'-phosphate oxidase family protein n=1 Tax=Armatimonas sp. TaxID=1872638 RepID=UPI00374D7433